MADPRPMRRPRLMKAAMEILAERESVALAAEKRYLAQSNDEGRAYSLRAARTEKAAAEEAVTLMTHIRALKRGRAADLLKEMIELAASRGKTLCETAERCFENGELDEAACYRCAGFEAKHIGERLSQLVAAKT